MSHLDSSANKDEHSMQIKDRRRRRTDQNNRDYTCGCGKSYLSYAALYTHLNLRHKHDSKPPNGTWLANNNSQKNGRGRPRRVWHFLHNLSKMMIEKATSLTTTSRTLATNQKKHSKKCSPSQTALAATGTPHALAPRKKSRHSFWATSPRTSLLTARTTPSSSTSSRRSQTRRFLLLNLSKDLEPSHRPHKQGGDGQRPEYSQDAYRQDTRLLSHLDRLQAHRRRLQGDGRVHRVLLQILEHAWLPSDRNIRTGQEKRRGEEDQCEARDAEGQANYCDEQNGEHILLSANEFVLQKLPQYFQQMGPQESSFEIFGSHLEKLKNAVYITQHLSYWLYAFKFTNSRLQIFTDED